MKRRSLLAGVGTAALPGIAGCAGVLGSGGGGEIPRSDRPLVDRTFEAGPTSPPCRSSGKKHYPPMSRRPVLFQAVPNSTDPEAVAAFVRERSEITNRVHLREKRYARIAWRGGTDNITERYNSERHYVGEVKNADGRHALLVVLYPTYTRVVHYETAANC